MSERVAEPRVTAIAPAQKAASTSPRGAKVPRNVRFYVAAGIAVVLSGLLGWQLIHTATMRKEYAAERATTAAEHGNQLDAQATALLRTSGALLRWALVPSLAAGDFDTIESHIKPLVREAPIMVVAVADDTGQIRIATNHKLEGSDLATAFPGTDATGEDVSVLHLDTGLVAIVPVLDANREIGRAVIYFDHAH